VFPARAAGRERLIIRGSLKEQSLRERPLKERSSK
jgi:hypothetical protein